MAWPATYYFGDPRQFQGYTSTLQDENSLLDYWFYPNRSYLEEVRKENMKVEDAAKKGKGGDGGGGGGGGGKKEGGGGGSGGGGKKEGDKEGDKKDGDKKKPESDNKAKVIELKVRLCCDECARKVKKKIEKLDGVEKGVICDLYENKVIVKATTKPEIVLKQAQKVKRDAMVWPQKKKEPEKKDEKKDDKKKN